MSAGGNVRWAKVLAMPEMFGFFALERGAPADLVLARIATIECEILSLGVSHGRGRAGLGRALVQAVLDGAASPGIRAAHREAAEDKEAAQRLCAAEGFAVTGGWPAMGR